MTMMMMLSAEQQQQQVPLYNTIPNVVMLHPADVSGIKSVYFICTRRALVVPRATALGRAAIMHDADSQNRILVWDSVGYAAQRMCKGNICESSELPLEMNANKVLVGQATCFPFFFRRTCVWEQHASRLICADGA